MDYHGTVIKRLKDVDENSRKSEEPEPNMTKHKAMLTEQDFRASKKETERKVNAETNQTEDKICNEPG